MGMLTDVNIGRFRTDGEVDEDDWGADARWDMNRVDV